MGSQASMYVGMWLAIYFICRLVFSGGKWLSKNGHKYDDLAHHCKNLTVGVVAV